jgi:chorismate dehydratase
MKSDDGCMSTYCPRKTSSSTQHPSTFPVSAVDEYEISGLDLLDHRLHSKLAASDEGQGPPAHGPAVYKELLEEVSTRERLPPTSEIEFQQKSHRVKIGAVSYLNSRPLLETLPFSVYKDVPSGLLNLFNSGKVDAALLSIYDIIKIPEAEVVDNIGIGCRGNVYSVILAYKGELKNIKNVQLDPSSHTSNQLLKIILAEFYHLYPNYLEEKNPSSQVEARLIIGDPAMTLREKTDCSILDLGGEWYRFTKLPFVFAMWCLNKESTQKEYIKKYLLRSKDEGLLLRAKIAAREPHPKLALRYLTKYIRYDVGPEEYQGIELFQSFLKKYTL